MTLAGRLSFARTGDARHDQCSQGTSAHVPGAVGAPLGLVRVRSPRTAPCGSPLSCLIHRSPASFRSQHSVATVARVFHPAGDDAQRKKRLKPVELVVAERDWEPGRPPFARDQIVGVRIAFADVAGRDRVKQAGSTWNPERRVWQLRYDRVVALGLHANIADGPASNSGCPTPSREHLHTDARPPSR